MHKCGEHNQFKNEAINRLKRARGHLAKVQKMLEDDEYCPNIIHQSRAVQAALKKVDETVLHGHLHSCVLKDVHGQDSEKVVQEIVELFEKR
jgi:DNA-binding FrmR family transcriptional regulator